LLDDDERKYGTTLNGVRVFGPLSDAGRWPDALFVNALGGPASFWRRPSLIVGSSLSRHQFASVVHPSAVVSAHSTLGVGAIVYPHVVVGAGATIGDHVTLLANTVVNHDASVGDYTIATSLVGVSGGVVVGECAYLGAGSHVMQGVRVGSGCLVGMGSIVRRDIPDRQVVAGNPARVLRSLDDHIAVHTARVTSL
jgi:sugar O-acyltransferase (sialic acid O-acetyltransferase NeuD family)